MIQFSVITLFPEMFGALKYGIVGRALENGLIKIDAINPRDFTTDKHHTVDDRPYGGGPGMVMQAKPLCDAIKFAKKQLSSKAAATKVIYLSPQGKPLDQQGLVVLSQRQNIILLAGRYEGIDQRLIETEIDEQYSIGDYVLSGGELAAMVMVDGITRLLPGALGHEASAQEDSFMQGLLDCPHYTRPEVYSGLTVPKVLLSGNHKHIARWRLKQALGQTWLKRPDLLEKRPLTQEEQQLLNEFRHEFTSS